MKKVVLLILTVTFLFVGMITCYAEKVFVMNGICTGGNGTNCEIVAGGDGDYIALPGKTYKYIVSFSKGIFEDTEDFKTATITLSPGSGVSMGAVSYLNNNYTVSKSGNTYSFTRKDNTDEEGGLQFTFTLPTNNNPGLTPYKFSSSIVVKDSNGTTLISESKTETINIVTKASNNYEDNPNVKSITISEGTLTPAFTAGGSAYSFEVTKEDLNVNIQLESSKSVLYYYGYTTNDKEIEEFQNGVKNANSRNFKIGYGTSVIYYTIKTEKAENKQNLQLPGSYSCLFNSCEDITSVDGGTSKFLFLTVTRKDTRSTVNTLNTLSITGAKIDFKKDLKIYNVTVPNSVSDITISSTLTDSKSKYASGFGNRKVTLKEGSNTVLVKVLSEQGKENVYTIIVTRELSSDNTIKEITLNGKTIKVNDKDLKYEVKVNNDVVNVDIKVVTNHPNAKYEIQKTEGDLIEGINKIGIIVTAPNGEKKVYSLEVDRDKKISGNANLESLKIEGYDIEFYSNVKEYSIKIKEDETELKITPKCEHSKAKYVISGNKNLTKDSVVKIKVTAEDGTENTYSIKIDKDVKSNGLLIIAIIGGALLLIGGVVGVILIKGRSKKKVSSLKSAEVNQVVDTVAPVVNDAPTPEPVVNPTPVVEQVPEATTVNEPTVENNQINQNINN